MQGHTNFVVSEPYAITFDYPATTALTFTITETLDAYHGTPDYTKEGGVDWGQPTRLENGVKVYTNASPKPATNANIGADGTALAWGYLKQTDPNAPKMVRTVLTNAPMISGLWTQYVWEHAVIEIKVTDAQGRTATYDFTFDLSRKPVAGPSFTYTIKQVS